MSVSTHGTTGRCPACGGSLDEHEDVPSHMRSGDCSAVQNGGGD